MDKPLVLIDVPLPGMIQELMEPLCVTMPWEAARAEDAGRRAAVAGLFTYGHPPVDGALLDRLPSLKVVSNFGVGVDHIDLGAAAARGIPVGNTPGAVDGATADLTMAILLAAARNVVRGDRFARSPAFTRYDPSLLLGTDVHESVLGIVGMGRVGRQVARRARGFDMRVLYYNRTRLAADDEAKLSATWVERDALLAQSDFIVVMAPYSPATHHLIGAAEIAKMKPTAILVNSARGGVVDDAALVAALEEKRIAAAGLDVFEGEPRTHPGFLGLPNVVMTPHIGSASRATRLNMCRTAAANLTAVLEGKDPPNPVN